MNNNIKDIERPLDDNILCPCDIVKLQQNYNTTQISILIAIVQKLQPVLRRQLFGLRSDRAPLFPDDRLCEGYVIVNIPMKMVLGIRKDYRMVRKAFSKMEDMPVSLMLRHDNKLQMCRLKRLFRVVFPEEFRGMNAYVYFRHEVANSLFDFKNGFFSVSHATLLACKHRSTQILYMLCEKWRDKSMVVVSVDTLVSMLLAGGRYRSFSDFRYHKIDVAQKELLLLYRQSRSTCYFTYSLVYGGDNTKREPSSVRFFIHVAGGDSTANIVAMRQSVEYLLTTLFRMPSKPTEMLVASVTPWNYQTVINKIRELHARYRHRGGITDIHAYTFAAIKKTIKALEDQDEKSQELPFAA